MKITVTGTAPHPQGLMVGLRVEVQRAGWIRFATTVLIVEDLSNDDRRAITEALNKSADRVREDLDTPLF